MEFIGPRKRYENVMWNWYWRRIRRKHLSSHKESLSAYENGDKKNPELWDDTGIILPIVVAGLSEKTHLSAQSILSGENLKMSERILLVKVLEEEIARPIDEDSDAEFYCSICTDVFYAFHYLNFLAADQPDILPDQTNDLIDKYRDFIMRIASGGQNKLELLREQEKAKETALH